MTEADKLKYVKKSSNQKTFDQTLDELDSLIGRLDAKNKTAALRILESMDELHHQFGDQLKLDEEGNPQNSQLGYLYQQIRKQASALINALGGSQFFQAKRLGQEIPKSTWWWYLDEYLEQKRRKSFLRMVKGFAIFAVVLVILIFAYQRWFAPPPEVRARLRFENQASMAIEDGRYTDALAAVEEALQIDPAQFSLWVQRGVLLNRLGEDAEAEQSFEKALALGIDQERYYIERIYNAAQMKMIEQTQQDIDQLLTINPQSAEGYLFQGQLLESQGDTYGAIQAYESASRFAEEQEKIELMTTIRMRLGMLIQSASLPTLEN